MEVYQAQEWEQSRGFVSPAPTRNNITTIYTSTSTDITTISTQVELRSKPEKKFPVDNTLKFKRREELVSSVF